MKSFLNTTSPRSRPYRKSLQSEEPGPNNKPRRTHDNNTSITPGTDRLCRHAWHLAPPSSTAKAAPAPGTTTPINKTPSVRPPEFRAINGVGNSPRNPEWGASDQHFLRLLPAADEDDKISKKEIRNTPKALSSLDHDQGGELTHLELPPSDPAMAGHLAAK